MTMGSKAARASMPVEANVVRLATFTWLWLLPRVAARERARTCPISGDNATQEIRIAEALSGLDFGAPCLGLLSLSEHP